MRFDLRKIRSPRERYENVYKPDAFLRHAEAFTIAEPVELSFDIFKDKQQYRLVGSIRTTLALPCSRCLEPFRWTVDAQYDLRYQPRSQNVGEDEREIEEDDLSTAYYEGEELDLGQLMQEQFYLSLPMKPLCRDDCKGLCPLCGTNLNRGSCDCKRDWEDPRFAALRALKPAGGRGQN